MLIKKPSFCNKPRVLALMMPRVSSVSGNTLIRMRLRRKKSGKASVLQAQVALDTARTQLGYAKVKAEIGGVISACDITEGSTVSMQSAAMKIANMDKVKLSFNISDDVINRVSVGSKAYIAISSASDTPYEGTVTNISPVADSQTMLYPVEIYIDNVDHHIKPGMFASIKLVLSTKENTISVPLNSIIEENDEKEGGNYAI